MSSQRNVIVTGGCLTIPLIKEIGADDFVIGIDKGALFLIQHEVIPHISMGDFDSVSEQERQIIQQKSKRFVCCDPVNKTMTDTEIGFHFALEQNAQHILILGGTGSRMDHTLANLFLLLRAAEQKVACVIQDSCNKITIITGTTRVKNEGYTYVSIFPITAEVTGITLKGFKYPLCKATMRIGQCFGISNELIDTHGTIEFTKGKLLLIQSKDNQADL